MAAVWAVLLGGTVGMSSWIAHRDIRQQLLGNLRQEIERDASEIRLRLQTWIDAIQEDTRSSSQSPLVREFLYQLGSDEELRWRELLEDEFRATFAGKPAYFQMRLLSAADPDDGNEIVRLDLAGEELIVIPRDRLQNKSGRSYYQEALATPTGDIYVSKIDLNRDFGAITTPPIPTIRAAAEVGGGDTPPAILIINADLRPLFAELRHLTSPSIEIRLYDDSGDYLLHPDVRATFGSDLGHDVRARDVQVDELAVSDRIQIGGWPTRQLTLEVSVPEEVRRSQLDRSWRRGLWATILAVFAGAAVAILVSLPLTARLHRLHRLSNALREFDAHDEGDQTKLMDARGDEIGVAIDRFREMTRNVRDQVETLQAARDEAHEANATKEAFLATMSHEVRTPMNAIVGLIRALEDNDPPDRQAPILASLRASAHNLVNLLNTALDYTRLRDGTMNYVSEPFDASRLVHEVVDSLRPSALAKLLELRIEVPETLFVRGDPIRLRQVINNLANNAIKFTSQGFVEVVLRHADGFLQCKVIDSGPGIREEHREAVFTPFVSIGQGSSRIESGAGLGLSVSKEIVEQQGGEARLESRDGEGASFIVTLPYPVLPAPVSAAALKPGAAMDSLVAAGELRVLYVEDVASNREVMALTLEGTTIELILAADAAEALDLLDSESFDLIMVDLQLPDLAGDELARRIHLRWPGLPIVAVTARSAARTDPNLREAGIGEVVIKPYSREEIFALIVRQTAIAATAEFEALHPGDPTRAAMLAEKIAVEMREAARKLASLKTHTDSEVVAAGIEDIRHKLKTAMAQFQLDDLRRALLRLAEQPGNYDAVFDESISLLETAARQLELSTLTSC